MLFYKPIQSTIYVTRHFKPYQPNLKLFQASRNFVFMVSFSSTCFELFGELSLLGELKEIAFMSLINPSTAALIDIAKSAYLDILTTLMIGKG